MIVTQDRTNWTMQMYSNRTYERKRPKIKKKSLGWYVKKESAETIFLRKEYHCRLFLKLILLIKMFVSLQFPKNTNRTKKHVDWISIQCADIFLLKLCTNIFFFKIKCVSKIILWFSWYNILTLNCLKSRRASKSELFRSVKWAEKGQHS